MLWSTRSRTARVMSFLALAVMLRSCMPFQTTTVHTIGYKLVADHREVDPATGDVILTSSWLYDDGVAVTTTKRIPNGVEERQYDRPPRPDLRFTD